MFVTSYSILVYSMIRKFHGLIEMLAMFVLLSLSLVFPKAILWFHDFEMSSRLLYIGFRFSSGKTWQDLAWFGALQLYVYIMSTAYV